MAQNRFHLNTNSIHGVEDVLMLSQCALGLSNVHVASLGESFVNKIASLATLMSNDEDIGRIWGASAHYQFAETELEVVAPLWAF